MMPGLVDKFAFYIPQSKRARKPIERLRTLAQRRDRSVNYLVLQAILEYLDREERKET